MIASHGHQFIFIKTRKTGSTSAEIVLSSWCGENDVCTPLQPEDEVLRRTYGGEPRNFMSDPLEEIEYREAIASGDIGRIGQVHRAQRPRHVFRNHLPASRVRVLLPDLWKTAFKFAFDRHPYEKAVSLAYYRSAERGSSFETALNDVVYGDLYANHPLYMENGRILVDAVYRYENLWNQIGALATKLGRQLPEPLPRAKAIFRQDRRSGAKILTSAHKTHIAERCSVEFDLLGYER